ncbi:asparagine synthase (glutamine-hydrolyzing) [Ferrovibrio sp.]|uniref:asparagine synthase (glutamine-hydrolyzing) n=1 Tax=Ferrovibrio sp. TaxID=1917215 RepID=UPI0035AEBF1C
MCGIWASVDLGGGAAALRLLAHRGPDRDALRSFELAGRTVELGHRRLAIIDLDHRADQPMEDPDGRYWIVYNGEIYNYLELRAELEAAGEAFVTRSDTEVLLAAVRRWGEAALPRLVGMFAFVILDRTNNELFVARDPFGIKPLFWVQTARGLAFSSEIPPLLELPGISRRANAAQLYKYVRLGSTDGQAETMFRDVHSFPAAHYARIRLDRDAAAVQPVRYWAAKARPQQIDFETARQNIRDIFLENIRLHLRSDVPVGAALSGGVDSSSVVGAIRVIGGSSVDIRSFSFIAPGADIDESRWIDIAAQAAGAQSHTVQATSQDLVDDLDDLIRVQGEPFGSTSIYAQYRVFRLAARNGVKVMLDGQGADEIFAGYRPFFAAKLAGLLAGGRLDKALQFLRAASSYPDVTVRDLAIHALGLLAPEWLRPLGRKVVGAPLAPAWLNAGWLERQGVGLQEPSASYGRHALHDRLAESLSETILPALLRYEDRNSMAWSIESRVPFLTTSLVDAAYALPADYLVSSQGSSKHVFREAMRGIVPDVILDRRDKIGFATPEKSWLRDLSPWVDATLASPAAAGVPLLNLPAIQTVWDGLKASSRPFDFQMWRWLNVIRWAECFNVRFD